MAPRRGSVSPAMLRELTDRAERTLTQGHLGQHILFHALHQNAVPERAPEIFGTRDRDEFVQVPPRRAQPAADLRAQRAHAGRGPARRLGRLARRRGARRRRRLAAARAGPGDAGSPAAPDPALARPEPLQRPVRRRQQAGSAGGRRRQAPEHLLRRAPRRLGRLPGGRVGGRAPRRDPRPRGAARRAPVLRHAAEPARRPSGRARRTTRSSRPKATWWRSRPRSRPIPWPSASAR